MFSNKTTKIDEIFTINLTLCSRCQLDAEDFINFCGLLKKHKFTKKIGYLYSLDRQRRSRFMMFIFLYQNDHHRPRTSLTVQAVDSRFVKTCHELDIKSSLLQIFSCCGGACTEHNTVHFLIKTLQSVHIIDVLLRCQ